jgi:hypothetical protein
VRQRRVAGLRRSGRAHRRRAARAQEHIWVAPQVLSQPANRVLRWRRDFIALNLAQVGRLDADPASDLSQRYISRVRRERLATLPNESPKRLCHVY